MLILQRWMYLIIITLPACITYVQVNEWLGKESIASLLAIPISVLVLFSWTWIFNKVISKYPKKQTPQGESGERDKV